VGASVLVGMYTGKLDQLEQCVVSAEKRCKERGLTILIFADEGEGFTLVALVKEIGTPIPPTLAAEYPAASVIEC
jgi:hypothetical protein